MRAGIVRLGAAANGKVVNAHTLHAASDEPRRAVRGEKRRVPKPFLGARALAAPTGVEQDDAVGQVSGEAFGQVLWADGLVGRTAGEIRDVGATAELFQREGINGAATGELVERGVEVRPGVAGEREALEVPAILGVVRQKGKR